MKTIGMYRRTEIHNDLGHRARYVQIFHLYDEDGEFVD